MNRDDIIRMAREAGYGDAMADLHAFALERFAALVAAEKDKQIYAICELAHRTGVTTEREACAKLCEGTTASWSQSDYNSGCVDCANAIRARGEI